MRTPVGVSKGCENIGTASNSRDDNIMCRKKLPVYGAASIEEEESCSGIDWIDEWEEWWGGFLWGPNTWCMGSEDFTFLKNFGVWIGVREVFWSWQVSWIGDYIAMNKLNMAGDMREPCCSILACREGKRVKLCRQLAVSTFKYGRELFIIA